MFLAADLLRQKRIPHVFAVFVSNCLKSILENFDSEKNYHVKGIENPADRGSKLSMDNCVKDAWLNGLLLGKPEWNCFTHLNAQMLYKDNYGLELKMTSKTNFISLQVT